MKSLADLKRTLTVGTTIEVTEHEYPRLMGERTVVAWRSNRVCLTIPGVPERDGSWWTLPKREHITFNDDGSVTVLRDPEWGDAGVFMAFHVKG